VPSDVSPNVQAKRGAKAARGAGPVMHYRGPRPKLLPLARTGAAMAVPPRAGCSRKTNPMRRGLQAKETASTNARRLSRRGSVSGRLTG